MRGIDIKTLGFLLIGINILGCSSLTTVDLDEYPKKEPFSIVGNVNLEALNSKLVIIDSRPNGKQSMDAFLWS